MPVFEANSVKYLIIVALSIILAAVINPLLILLWPAILLLDDIAYFSFQKSLFDTEIAIQRGYQFAYIFLEDQSGYGRDLGFNLFGYPKIKWNLRKVRYAMLLFFLDPHHIHK